MGLGVTKILAPHTVTLLRSRSLGELAYLFDIFCFYSLLSLTFVRLTYYGLLLYEES
jgi:hypothetical protein